MTAQPNYKLVANMGDANFADYGGMLVYEDTTGVYAPQIEYWEAPEDENYSGWLYRFDVEPCYYTNGILSDNKYHLDYEVWWADTLATIADGIGLTHEKAIEMVTSGTIQERATIYRELALYHGFENFDGYPRKMKDAEAQERYKDIPRH